MVPVNLDPLKNLLPFNLAGKYPENKEMEMDYDESPSKPLTPFCCVSAIPSSFRYLAELLPASTTHNPQMKPTTSAPIITVFLLYITNCYHHPHAPQPKEIRRTSASNLYYAIMQLTTHQTSVTSTIPTSLSSSPALKSSNLFNTILCRSSATSVSRFIDEGFTDIPLHPQPLQPEKTVRYFVPIENSRDSTILNPGQNIKGKLWKEISEIAAMESLRFLGSGIWIGDGENWKELEGLERLSCPGHKMDFVLRLWIKES